MKFTTIDAFETELRGLVAQLSAPLKERDALTNENLEKLLMGVPDEWQKEVANIFLTKIVNNGNQYKIGDEILYYGSDEVRVQLFCIKQAAGVLESSKDEDIGTIKTTSKYQSDSDNTGARTYYELLTGKTRLEAAREAGRKYRESLQESEQKRSEDGGDGQPAKSPFSIREFFKNHGRKFMWVLGIAVFTFLMLIAFPPFGVTIPFIAAMPASVAAALATAVTWIMASAAHMVAAIAAGIVAGLAFAYPDRVLGLIGFAVGYVMASPVFSFPAGVFAKIAELAVHWFSESWRVMTYRQHQEDGIPLKQRGSQDSQVMMEGKASPPLWARAVAFFGVVFFGIGSLVALPLMGLFYGIALAGTRILDRPYVHMCAVYLRESFPVRLFLQPMQTIRGLISPKLVLERSVNVSLADRDTASIRPLKFTETLNGMSDSLEAPKSKWVGLGGDDGLIGQVEKKVDRMLSKMFPPTLFKERNPVRDALAMKAGYELPLETSCPAPKGMSGGGS